MPATSPFSQWPANWARVQQKLLPRSKEEKNNLRIAVAASPITTEACIEAPTATKIHKHNHVRIEDDDDDHEEDQMTIGTRTRWRFQVLDPGINCRVQPLQQLTEGFF